MKKLLILLILFSFGCASSKPKFKYKENVKVSTGFFENCSGVVMAHITRGATYHYVVEASCKQTPNIILTLEIAESNLKSLEKK